jgi:hypothetical protein
MSLHVRVPPELPLTRTVGLSRLERLPMKQETV